MRTRLYTETWELLLLICIIVIPMTSYKNLCLQATVRQAYTVLINVLVFKKSFCSSPVSFVSGLILS